MKNARRLGALALAVAMAAAIAVPVMAAETTVGRFVQELAKAKNLNAADPRIAGDSLAAVGIRLPAGVKFSDALTENVVAEISRSAGLRVTTTRPDATFSQDQVDQFFMTFGSELGSSSRPGDDSSDLTRDRKDGKFNPYTKGKGGSKGKKKGNHSPIEPE